MCNSACGKTAILSTSRCAEIFQPLQALPRFFHIKIYYYDYYLIILYFYIYSDTKECVI